MKPLIRCGFGIGNRVAMIANALSRDSEIRFVWRNNFHLPLSHREVFPVGIPGVEFVDAVPGFATRWARVPGESWEAAQDRDKANAAYGLIMGYMIGEAAEPVDVAIMARFFRWPETSPQELAKEAAKHGDRVFVLADSRRMELVNALTRFGVKAVLPESPTMAHDKDRSADSMRKYLRDWKRAVAAKIIITTKGASSSIFPALAAGKTIISN